MESALKAALRRLCALHGWLYGVFLQADRCDPSLLAPVEIYYEERTPAAIISALRRVHRVGEGTFIKVVLSGGHHWISSDAQSLESFRSNESGEVPELNPLFLAGIKTVAAVSLLPFGVVLFGSTLKVPESSDFINQIRHSFRKLGNSTGLLLRGAHQNASFRERLREHSPGGLSSLILSGNLHEENIRSAAAGPLLTSPLAFPLGRSDSSLSSAGGGPPCVNPPNLTEWDVEMFLASSDGGNLPSILPLSSLDLDGDYSLRDDCSSGANFDFLDVVDFDLRKAFLGQSLWEDDDLKKVLATCRNEEIQFPEKERVDFSAGVSHANSVNNIGHDDLRGPLTGFSQRMGDGAKAPKKRARPGESTRPRPRDRQQIQDRVKELREIVPNGAKCSIDALLARTVNHMLFLQGVIKYADKIKQADEPKVISEESGIILRDDQGGATWAYDVAGQTIVCPASIQEVDPLGQMLIEILCEDRGSFLEMADSIRRFGLTILKGVMEARDQRIWARFLVEANRSTSRMEIFLHLVQLLAKMSAGGCLEGGPDRAVDCGMYGAYQQSLMAVPSGSADRSR